MIKRDRLLKELKHLLPGVLLFAIVLACGYVTRNDGEPTTTASAPLAVRSTQ